MHETFLDLGCTLTCWRNLKLILLDLTKVLVQLQTDLVDRFFELLHLI
jgi:hypothetical protein